MIKYSDQKALEKESKRMQAVLRKARSDVEVEQDKLARLKKATAKPVISTVKAAQTSKTNNEVREARLKLELINNDMQNIVNRKTRFEDENNQLEIDNDRLKVTNEKARAEKASLTGTLIKASELIKTNEKASLDEIDRRFKKVDKLAAEYKQDMEDLAREQVTLKSEIKRYRDKQNDLEKEREKILTTQAELNIAIENMNKEKVKMIAKQKSLANNISELKHEENRIEILQLRVVKIINDNKTIQELQKLRKELLK